MFRMLALSIFLLAIPPQAAGADPWMGQSVFLAPDVYNGAVSPAAELDAGRAEELFAEAQDAAASGALSRAFELATQTLHADPQHAAAREVLGYVLSDAAAEGAPDGGEWLTPYQAHQRRRGYRWSPDFGWLRTDEAPRYEAGERRVGRRWISAEDDARQRQHISDGWTVRTDHFAVTSNHSLGSAARLAAQLEDLFQVWRQWFAGYWLEEREVRALFAGERSARKRSRPMYVFHHRDKESYVSHLRRRQSRIAETLGIYFDDIREAHFYAGGADGGLGREVLYHEAAHQLFAENGPGRRGVGRDANYWLVEGVACYFELLAPVTGEPRATLGDPAQGRLPSAVANGPTMPLVELAPLGQSDLQRLPNLREVYAQAAGLVAMLRHGEHAATDREALVATLRAIYGGQPDGEELARRTGRTDAELDRQYWRFLANLSR